MYILISVCISHGSTRLHNTHTLNGVCVCDGVCVCVCVCVFDKIIAFKPTTCGKLLVTTVYI